MMGPTESFLLFTLRCGHELELIEDVPAAPDIVRAAVEGLLVADFSKDERLSTKVH